MLIDVSSRDAAFPPSALNVTGPALLAAIEAGTAPTILDVRTGGEFARGHVPGAIHIPFQAVARRLAEIPSGPDDPIVVYCGHGPRAWMAARVLRARGFRRVSYLTGHWSGWRRAGLRDER
jgi:rhodanese-related sulfurtransferase